ncbi:MAG: hypothetical protein ACR2O0_08050, partial [Rhizobiaceae bacterium]
QNMMNPIMKSEKAGRRNAIAGNSGKAGLRKLVKKAIDGHLPSMREVLKRCEDHGLIAPPKAAEGGGVVTVPQGRDLNEWLDEVTEWVPADQCD